MTILALEFSSAQRSVAVLRDRRVLGEAMEAGGQRVTNAFGLIVKVLAAAKAAREEIEVIAVGLGPGSYTGIRAAIAVAQGWQLARSTKLLGVMSSEAIAFGAWEEGLFGRVNVVIDAQRGEFYIATWELSAAACRELSPLKIVSASAVAALTSAGEICLGPATGTIRFPRAASVGRLAVERHGFVPGEALEPVYLREPTFIKSPPGRIIA